MARTKADPVNFTRYRINQALRYGDKGKPVASLFNVAAVLEQDDRWTGVLAWDQMASQVVKRKPPPFLGGEVGAWSDVDEIRTSIWIAEHYDFNPNIHDVRRAMLSAAQRSPFHPVRQYLEAIEWDRTPRVLDWVCRYLGAEDAGETGAYHLSAGSKWLISAVARVMRPGCKADNVLILEGPQGRLKSSALAVLGGEWFMDTPFNLHDKDRFTHIQGRWIVELAELDGFSRAESSAAKAFFSSPQDRYTPKYIAHAIEVKRQVVFAGTVNLGTYLHDKTGNRRYWPVRVGEINLEALRRDRDQIWAEALVRYAAGEKWWVSEQAEAAIFALEQSLRETPDALEELIGAYVEVHEDVTMRQLLESLAPDVKIKDWTPALQNRVGHIMSALGWVVDGRPREQVLDEAGKAKPFRGRRYVRGPK